ncbi:response regulator transcription factor [Roseateles amylovorans]|uniref:Response regulator n=1 Tax=Roseateles amylovorans TaxID=2978473 RepID=A0ABY6AVU0_9BURK|nr:response regulator [Roseateles amylovorans]UXH76509.1 response regulator [Roseateles amylovorans]
MKKVLIVDDHADIRRLVRLTLEFEEVEVREAGTGPEALQILDHWLPDAMLMDMMMPGMDGLTLCRTVRANPLTANIPVLFLTARGQAKDREAGLQAGANAYLVKPFSPLQLIQELDRAGVGASA